MYAKRGIEDMTVEVPKALRDAWILHVSLEHELKVAKENLLIPIAKKNELLERFRQRLGLMNSQNRAQQVLDQAEERLEKWVQDQLPTYQARVDEVALSLSKNMGRMNELLEAEERKLSRESFPEDPVVDALQGEMDALLLEANIPDPAPCINLRVSSPTLITPNLYSYKNVKCNYITLLPQKPERILI